MDVGMVAEDGSEPSRGSTMSNPRQAAPGSEPPGPRLARLPEWRFARDHTIVVLASSGQQTRTGRAERKGVTGE